MGITVEVFQSLGISPLFQILLMLSSSLRLLALDKLRIIVVEILSGPGARFFVLLIELVNSSYVKSFVKGLGAVEKSTGSPSVISLLEKKAPKALACARGETIMTFDIEIFL